MSIKPGGNKTPKSSNIEIELFAGRVNDLPGYHPSREGITPTSAKPEGLYSSNVRCEYCGSYVSRRTAENGKCTQCGAPFAMYKIVKYEGESLI